MWRQSKNKKQTQRDRALFGLANQVRTAHTIVCCTHGTATNSTTDQRNESARLRRYRIGTILKPLLLFWSHVHRHTHNSVILFEQFMLVCQ
ncbi:hypothetical protein AHF37_08494 [Paragonimus kellicotti]|nr:hypothetical protein AHF37_08494 [Paragonimus kellicotti]